MEHKNKKIAIIVPSIFIIIAIIGITYAYVSKTLAGTKKVILTAGTLSLVLAEENEITISDALPMYDAVGMIQEKVFNFSLNNNTSNLTEYTIKLQKVSTSNELSTSDVKYYLTKDGVGTPALLSSLTDGVVDTGTIAGNQTIEYTLRLWINEDVTDNSAISGKSLSYKLAVEASMTDAVELAYATNTAELVSDTTQLGENCKTYNDGVDTFLVGQCSNNYVWYSGKLWRVVLKNNETGAVKMVTDKGITSIAYNSYNNTTFENSYMDQWLNQEFLPTLHDYEDYLVVDSIWDATENSSDTPSRPTYATSVARTVGLLNVYEYYTTYASSDNLATDDTGYLDAGVYWWLMTPYNESNVRSITFFGQLSSSALHISNGVRPSVNLKSGIRISGGTGIQSDPYILEGDLQEPVNGTTLLNTRYSGEYVTFNNELYRIVDVENGLTKITAVDIPSVLSSLMFDSDTETSVTNFAVADIKTDLENYYQGLKTTNETAYNMIHPNTTWYLGTVESSVNYKASICANIDTNTSMNDCVDKATSTIANIGLPRIGEMFTSQITRGKRTTFWTLTPNSSHHVRIVFSAYGFINSDETTVSNDARPSMYLKQNVVISSDNTGNGTYEHPYSLSIN